MSGLTSTLLFDALPKSNPKEEWEKRWEERQKKEWEKYIKEKEKKPKEEWEKKWRKLEKEMEIKYEEEEERMLKSLYAARLASEKKLEDVLRDLTEIKVKLPPTRTAREKAAKYEALEMMGIPREWAVKKPWQAGTRLGVRVLYDAQARCMHEALKVGEYLGDAYMFLQKARTEPERAGRWLVRFFTKSRKLEEEREELYDLCGVMLPEKPLDYREYDEYYNDLKRKFREKERKLELAQKLSRSKFSFPSVPRCGYNMIDLMRMIGEIKSLIMAGEPGYEPFPEGEEIKNLILEKIGLPEKEEEEKRPLLKRKVTLKSIIDRLERDACSCSEPRDRKEIYRMLETIVRKIKEGDITVMDDIEDLEDQFGYCLSRKMLPVKIPVKEAKTVEEVVTSRVMTDLISKWKAEKKLEEAAKEFYTEKTIMEMMLSTFGKATEKLETS